MPGRLIRAETADIRYFAEICIRAIIKCISFAFDKCKLIAYTDVMHRHGKLHDCKEELRNVALKVTPARLAVLDALEHADKPMDVSSVITHLKKKHVSADEVTVFRILNMFSKKGLITPVQFNEHKLRYEYADKPPHHHFICEECGEVTDVDGCMIGVIEAQIEKTLGGKVTRHSLEFFGRCRRCVV